MMKKTLFAVFVFCAALNTIQAQDAANTAEDAARPDESTLLLDAPQPAQTAADGGALRENEQNYPLGEGSLQGGVSIWSVLRILIVLVIVSLAIYGIIYFLKKSKQKEPADNAYLKILAAAPINARTAAAVVSVGSSAWLVGVSDASVSLISPLNDQETVDAMLLDYSERAAQGNALRFPNFFSMLQRLVPRESEAGAAPETRDHKKSALHKNRDRLRGL
ncbi:MAG: flagellar biosynthetic protein FliO [Spirochaetaceae bacterium]|jgi:flagellar protein FliO/FliZ|nr:flagellar biosynthetic protein FliO [Spirochaetaceae bacterium]